MAAKPRGILDHSIGPNSLHGSYYTYSYNKSRGPVDEAKSAPPHGQSVFVRNNPHPGRVRHFKGLCDAPICNVEDARTEGHRLMSAPSGERYRRSSSFRVPGSTRYSGNTDKMLSAVGIVPVTFAWRDELEKLAKDVVDKAMKTTPTGSSHGKFLYGHMDENKMLELMCRILRTDSISIVQSWLQEASDNEKDIVLNMLHMAATGEMSYDPTSSETGSRSKPESTKGPQRFYYEPEEEDEAADVFPELGRASLMAAPPLSTTMRLAPNSRPRTRNTISVATPLELQRSRTSRTRHGISDKPREGENRTAVGNVAGNRLSINNGSEKLWSSKSGLRPAKSDPTKGSLGYSKTWSPQ